MFYIQNFSGCFDTSGSMIPLSVPEICDIFRDVQQGQEEQEQELGFLYGMGFGCKKTPEQQQAKMALFLDSRNLLIGSEY